MHIRKMQSSCRFIQDIHRFSGAALTQFRRQFDPLRFSSRQCGGWLSKTNVRQSYIIQRLHFPADARHIFKEMKCFFHSHIEYIINTFSFIFYLQRLTVIPFSMTNFTWYIDIRQKVHLDFQNPISTARFTSSSLDIKTESSFLIPSGLCVCCCRKQITDQIKDSRISCRIRSRRPSDWRLVYIDYFIYLFQPFDPRMLSRNCPGAVQFFCQCFI